MKHCLILSLMFFYGEMVRYPVSEFYSKACSGKGTITDFQVNKKTHKVKYLVEVDERNTACPLRAEYYSENVLKKIDVL